MGPGREVAPCRHRSGVQAAAGLRSVLWPAAACTLLLGCNAVWGIDDLGYGGSSGASSLGGLGGAAGATSTTGGSGGSGGASCTTICDSPPNTECYEPIGSCVPPNGECSYALKPDGTACADTTCTDWSACAWDGGCSNSGSHARTCTDFVCDSGTCTATARDEAGTCSRTVSNGSGCSAGYCCSNSCVPRDDDGNCGTCGVHCSSGGCVGITGHPGRYSCKCSSNDTCQHIGFGSIATCYSYNGQMLCNCQCPGGASSCKAECAGGGTCADVSGHNYCHY